jgi:hypothetical protein
MKATRMGPPAGGTIIGGGITRTQCLACAVLEGKTVPIRYEATMTDITADINRFREAARHLWNTWFTTRVNESTGVVFEAFGRICEEIFEVLVLDRHDIDEGGAQLNAQGFKSIRVVPAVAHGTPILVNRTNPAGPYWDDPTSVVKPVDVELELIGFFDWDSYRTIDMRYLRVRITSSAQIPSLAGREALLDVQYAIVLSVK